MPLHSALVLLAAAGDCSEPAYRVDCGQVGTNEQQCQQAGCCWGPVDPNPLNKPWCFKSGGAVKTCSLQAQPSAPFSADEIKQVEQNLVANVNFKNSGMVVAAPDPNTPGGSYEYAWMRDEALTWGAIIALGVDADPAPWVAWVKRSVAEQDPNNIDVRIEPKFDIPSGQPYTGGWCRPQTDGPGLRAIALIELWSAEQPKVAPDWSLVWTHLDWVAANVDFEGCDLWEEVKSQDFFWNKYTMRKALTLGAAAAAKVGDSGRADTYRKAADAAKAALAGHVADGWVFESSNRKLDTAVVEAFNVGDMADGVFAPLSKEVVATVKQLTDTFCGSFEVNQEAAKAGRPGVLYGRYPGDNYAGGNPWILLSASVATLFYRQAAAAAAGATVPEELHELLGGVADAKALVGSGDAILAMVKRSVGAGMHMSEQIGRQSGEMLSAHDLTWNYVNVLKAMHARAAVALPEEVLV